MARKKFPTEPHEWRQERLVLPELIECSLVVWLDGPMGLGGYSVEVREGLNLTLSECIVRPAIGLDDAIPTASAVWREVAQRHRLQLAPF